MLTCGRDDVVFSTHRGHGHALAKGVAPRQLIAELFGRATGCSHGRGGSMHLFAPEVGLMGTSGIVGPCILQAAGAGYSFKLLKTDRVAVAFFGDGAVNNGAFHEGLNMAGIWKLPVLFVCENNQFATEVPFAYAAGNPSVAARGAVYGMPGVEVDGNDVLAVYEAAARGGRPRPARRRARRCSSAGPTAPGPTPKAWATSPTAPAKRSRPGRRAARSRSLRPARRSRTGSLRTRRTRRDRRRDRRRSSPTPSQFAEASPWPDPATATRSRLTSRAGPRAVPGRPLRRARLASSPSCRRRSKRSPRRWRATPRIFVMGEGIGKRGGNFKTTAGLYDLYGPERLCDTPICERGFVGLGCGAAMTGTRPVIDFMFADFVLDAVGEIINQIAKMQYMSSGRLKMPILLRGCIGIGHSAATHHSGNYYPMFAHFPGLRVVVPSTPVRRQGAAQAALCGATIRALPRTSRAPRRQGAGAGRATTRSSSARPPSCARGRDVTVVALALMVHHDARRRARRWPREGISVELIDPRTVSPLDVETILRSVAQDRPAADRGRGVRPVRHRRRDRRPARRPRLRRPRRADPPAQRRLHADAVQPAAGSRRRPRSPTAIAQAIRDLVAE